MRTLIAFLLMLLAATTVWAAPDKTADKKFWTLTAATFASGIVDEEITQYKLGQLGVREGNPILGQTRKQAYPIIFGLGALSSYGAYRLKKGGATMWWLPQVVTIGVHGFAIGWNLHYRKQEP